ncbi:MAG: sirohydrochlorin cobaltochelatase [Odoribacter sp.]|nr:sirohydrochlorin cobaltochelatase [Odoribacter sp.]
MKKFFTIIFLFIVLICSAHGHADYKDIDIFSTMQPGDKAAILMVHFGTTHADTRALTIDALNKRISEQFPDLEIREAYTSRIIIKRLGDRGTIKLNTLEALKQLHADGYTHILIQVSTIINGVEMESIYKNVEVVEQLFKDVRIGNPLLFEPKDYEKAIDALTTNIDKNTAYVWVGHGTYDATTAQYAMLDYMLKDKGFDNIFVGTIEGYPEYDNVVHQLEKSGLKKVVLIPFIFVAGEHAKNDIAEDWKEELEEAGYTVELQLKGLGEYPAIQDIFISHLKFISKHKKIGIMEKKNLYQVTGEKM